VSTVAFVSLANWEESIDTLAGGEEQHGRGAAATPTTPAPAQRRRKIKPGWEPSLASSHTLAIRKGI